MHTYAIYYGTFNQCRTYEADGMMDALAQFFIEFSNRWALQDVNIIKRLHAHAWNQE